MNLAGGAVNPGVGSISEPGSELSVQVLQVTKRAAVEKPQAAGSPHCRRDRLPPGHHQRGQPLLPTGQYTLRAAGPRKMTFSLVPESSARASRGSGPIDGPGSDPGGAAVFNSEMLRFTACYGSRPVACRPSKTKGNPKRTHKARDQDKTTKRA